MHLLLFLSQSANTQLYITTVSPYIIYTSTCFDICNVIIRRQTSTLTTLIRHCIYSHKCALLVQETTTLNRIYCRTKQRIINILMYFNNIMEM